MNQPNFRPMDDIVLVTQEVAPDEIGTVGLVQPQTAKERPNHGTVLRVGPKVSPQVSPGDTIVYSKYSGKPLVVDGETFLYLKECEIVGILEDGSKVT